MARCSFCYGAHPVRDCPNIDPEQHRAADPHCTCNDCIAFHAGIVPTLDALLEQRAALKAAGATRSRLARLDAELATHVTSASAALKVINAIKGSK